MWPRTSSKALWWQPTSPWLGTSPNKAPCHSGALSGHLVGGTVSRQSPLSLEQLKAADPLHFPDLSLSIVKLLGPGEYVVGQPGEKAEGHFGLAVVDYTH